MHPWRTLLLVVLLTGLAAGAGSCGGVLGDGLGLSAALVLEERLLPGVDLRVVLYDGYRHGDYVYYRGDWYYHGWNTPYDLGYWDPYTYDLYYSGWY